MLHNILAESNKNMTIETNYIEYLCNIVKIFYAIWVIAREQEQKKNLEPKCRYFFKLSWILNKTC